MGGGKGCLPSPTPKVEEPRGRADRYESKAVDGTRWDDGECEHRDSKG